MAFNKEGSGTLPDSSNAGFPVLPNTNNNNPLARKLNKILETRIDNDKEMLEALKALSTFFGENSLRTRRNLRSDIERRNLLINEEFVQAFQVVEEQLSSVYTDVKGMNECCLDMTNRLKAAKEQTRDLLNQTTGLQTESQKLQMKAQVADAFLDKFQLKPEECKILRGSKSTGLHKDFFKVLSRVKQIHADCKVLLRTNQQTAGLEIMESMALQQESAYERLYRWTQSECRTLTGDSPDISPLLCMAMEALQDRPVLFKYSLDEFGTARRTAVVRGLIDALTRGGPGGTPRPIELHSHDPLRYVGDMLAWLHQATASEKEHLQTLIKMCKYEDSLIESILGHICEGVCRPFKVRVDQVLAAEQDAVILNKLNNLLKFYRNTVGHILGESESLTKTVEEMEVLSHQMFFNSLNCHASKLLDKHKLEEKIMESQTKKLINILLLLRDTQSFKVELPPPDLGPTSSLKESLQLLRDVLACQDASVVPLDNKKQDFKQVVSCVVDPVLQMCSVSASHLNTVDMAAYMVNCIYLTQSALALYQFTDTRLEMLQAQIDAQVDTLVSEQATFILNRVNLTQAYATVQQQMDKQCPMSTLQGLNAANLKSAMSKFDNYLASPDSHTLPQCSLLLSATVRDKVKKVSVELICDAYQHIYNCIYDAKNEYSDPQSIVPRTPDQVVKLLS